MTILEFNEKKRRKEKIVMVTCYDYSSAKIAALSEVDALLVGDSLAMTMFGESSTLPATTELIARHTQAVVKGAPNKLVVADMPFLSYRQDLNHTMASVAACMRTGAQAVKIEGAKGNESVIKHVVESGVPVMGHLGLTPQSVHQLGGYKVQGRESQKAANIIKEAKDLESWGCFSLVLECVPSALARTISQELEIPVIGIGAGPDTDGQILVWQDLLGQNLDFKPKFVRKYLDGQKLITDALNEYATDVKKNKFPNVTESFE